MRVVCEMRSAMNPIVVPNGVSPLYTQRDGVSASPTRMQPAENVLCSNSRSTHSSSVSILHYNGLRFISIY